MRSDPESEAPADMGSAGAGGADRKPLGSTASGAVQTEERSRLSTLTDIKAVAIYADRIETVARSLRKLVIEERVGRYARTVATITFDENGIAKAVPAERAPNEEEAAAIKTAWKEVVSHFEFS